jgi:hypothetical protein
MCREIRIARLMVSLVVQTFLRCSEDKWTLPCREKHYRQLNVLIGLRLILILASNPLLFFPKALLPSDFTTKILYTFLISTTRVTSSRHRILVDIRWIIYPGWYSVNNTKYEVHHVIFSNLMFSFHSLASVKLMYAILFIGMKVDIRTFTKLIFLCSYMTRQVIFNKTLATRTSGRRLSVIKMYTNNFISHKAMSIIRITFYDTKKPRTFPTKCT